MKAKLMRVLSYLLLLAATLGSLLPARPAAADGGPLVSRDLWASLTEGQQTAVITVMSREQAKVDLFVSIQDTTSQSHQVRFFLPLGTRADNFYVVEQDVVAFDDATNRGLDGFLNRSADARQAALTTLFAGTVLANGFLLAPLWAPIFLTGCGAGEPVATFQTESSQVDIYDVAADTSIDELIAAAGLPPAVAETLTRLRGQQIAVVNLTTHPVASGGGGGSYGQPQEPGLHLSWTTSLVPARGGSTFTYALGTGAAWSKPIEMTRVYVVTPPGLDFAVDFPHLGANKSGHQGLFGHPRIADYYQLPAYAVDEARGDFGRVWRVTYTQSNADRDITITVHPQSAWSRLSGAVQQNAPWLAFLFALILAPVLWVLAWVTLMPRLLGRRPEQQRHLRWYQSLIYPGINAALIVFPGTILLLLLSLGLVAPTLIVLVLVFGGFSLFAYWLIHSRNLGVSVGRAIGAFLVVSLAANAAYLVVALAFARLSGIL